MNEEQERMKKQGDSWLTQAISWDEDVGDNPFAQKDIDRSYISALLYYIHVGQENPFKKGDLVRIVLQEWDFDESFLRGRIGRVTWAVCNMVAVKVRGIKGELFFDLWDLEGI